MKRRKEKSPERTEWEDSAGVSFENTISEENSTDQLAGKIESLQMTNFMCHANLELKLNERINFITGRNGSGKSAIMAALIIVLGGSASHTKRGSSVTDFIKKGESWARVTITLINEGINPYKKDVYGNRIIICRSLSTSGKHGYVCKSVNGTIISKRKEEIDSIVLAFNLQIKNPICVLNQDVARSFLCSTDTSLRFSLFAKATQLEQLKLIYMKTLDLLAKSKKELEVKQKGIEVARTEIKELKGKLKLFASLEERVKERTSLENEYCWALVADAEDKVSKLLQTKNELLEKKKEYTVEESQFHNILKDLNDKINEYKHHLEEAKSKKERKTREKLEVQREVQHYEKEVGKMEAQMRILTGKIERHLVDINGIKEHLQQSDNLVIQSQAEKEQVSEKIRLIRQRLSDIKDEIANADRELQNAQKTVHLQYKNLEDKKADLGELEMNKKRLEIILGQAKAKGQNNYVKYGPHTQELLKAIEEATKKNLFHRRPIGPCGMHVRLTGDPKWARPVEFVIGGLMKTYQCDNQKDYVVLNKIMERICGKNHPTIIIGKFLPSRHNVEPRKASVRGLQSILDVLTFDNDVVFNTFVDQAQIEGIILFETDEQAASILTNIQNVPKNVKMGITLQSDQYYPAPNYRTYYGDSNRPLKYFDTAKSADAVKKLETEIKQTSFNIREKNLEIEKLREASRETSTLVERYKRKVKSLKQEEGNAEVELNHLKDMEETQPVPVRKAALEEELENLVKLHETCLVEKNKCGDVLEGLKEKRTEFVKKLNAIALEEAEEEKKMDDWDEKVREKKSKHGSLLSRRKGTDEKMESINRRLEEVEESVRKGEAFVEKKIKAAMEICSERIQTKRSPIEVQSLLEKCEKYLKAAEKIAGSREATIEEYKTKYSLFKEMISTAQLLENTIKILTTAACNKERKLNTLESHTSNLVSLYFQATLQTRGYDGLLRVDFDNKLLHLEVKPKDATIARSDSKTLSGGERSYSTVAFILAIWKVVHMPIYFLDEFDVFMDKVNRKVIMDLLLEHAKAQGNKQFVFITPQDISSIQNSDVINIYKMPDPERGLR